VHVLGCMPGRCGLGSVLLGLAQLGHRDGEPNEVRRQRPGQDGAVTAEVTCQREEPRGRGRLVVGHPQSEPMAPERRGVGFLPAYRYASVVVGLCYRRLVCDHVDAGAGSDLPRSARSAPGRQAPAPLTPPSRAPVLAVPSQ
jgi:hypothetical protein